MLGENKNIFKEANFSVAEIYTLFFLTYCSASISFFNQIKCCKERRNNCLFLILFHFKYLKVNNRLLNGEAEAGYACDPLVYA